MARRVFCSAACLPVPKDIVLNCIHLFVCLIGSIMFWSARFQFLKRLHLFQGILTLLRKLHVQLRSFRLPLQHFIGDLLDHLAGVAYEDAPWRNDRILRNKSQCSYNRAITHLNIVHNHGIHPDEHILAQRPAMNNSPMPYMRHLLEARFGFWKHMYGTILLHIDALFKHNPAPVATEHCPGPDVTMRPHDHIARHIGLGMYEGRRMYDGNEIKELVNSHLMRVLKWSHTPGQHQHTCSPKHISYRFLAILELQNERCDRLSLPMGGPMQWHRRSD